MPKPAKERTDTLRSLYSFAVLLQSSPYHHCYPCQPHLYLLLTRYLLLSRTKPITQPILNFTTSISVYPHSPRVLTRTSRQGDKPQYIKNSQTFTEDVNSKRKIIYASQPSRKVKCPSSRSTLAMNKHTHTHPSSLTCQTLQS